MRIRRVVLMAGGSAAFALMAAVVLFGAAAAGQYQMPRDLRPDQARPATDEERQLRIRIVTAGADSRSLLELARLQESRGAIADAVATLVRLGQMEPANVAPLHALAALYRRAGEFDRAVEVLQRAAALYPANAAGHHLIATYYFERAKAPGVRTLDKRTYLERAVAAEDRALEADPNFFEALVYKNLLLREQAAAANTVTAAALISEADALRELAGRVHRESSPASAHSEVIDLASAPPPPPPPPVPGAENIQWVYAETSYAAKGSSPTPVKVKDVRPVYAPMAIKYGIQGTVVIEAAVDQRGRVATARVIEGAPLLTQSLIDAVRQWQFDAATVPSSSQPVLITVTAHYVPPR